MMVMFKKLTGSSMSLWSLLFLIGHFLSPVIAAIHRWPNTTLRIDTDDRTADLNIEKPTATLKKPAATTTFINTFFAPTPTYWASFPEETEEWNYEHTDYFPVSTTSAVAPDPTPTPLSRCDSKPANITRELPVPHDRARLLLQVYSDTPLQPSEFAFAYPENFISSGSNFQDHQTENFTFYGSDFDDQQSRAGFRNASFGAEHMSFVSNLPTLVDEKRLRIISSSKARRLGSFVLSSFRGYTVDCGVNQLPKDWDPYTDPPLINDFVNEWAGAVTNKNREAADLANERKLSEATRQRRESETIMLKRSNSLLDWLIDRVSDTEAELNEKLEDAACFKRMQISLSLRAGKRDMHASKKYRQGVSMIISAKRIRDTTDPASTAVTVYIPPLYPPLPPTIFALLQPTTWRPKAAWRITRDKTWSLYQALCLRIALMALFCVLYMCDHEDELPSPHPHGRNIVPGSFDSPDDHASNSERDQVEAGFNSNSSPDTQSRQGQTQDRGTQTDLTDSGRTEMQKVTRNSQSVSESRAASTSPRALSPPRSQPVILEQRNTLGSPFPTANFDFTPPLPKSVLASRSSNAPSLSPARLSEPAATLARDPMRENPFATSQQAHLQPKSSSIATTSSAKEGKEVETKSEPAPTLPREPTEEKVLGTSQHAHLQSTSSPIPTTSSSTKGKEVDTKGLVLPVIQAAAPWAPVAFPFTALDSEGIAALAPEPTAITVIEPVEPASTNIVKTPSVNAIKLNPFPFHSLATRNTTNAMPALQPASTSIVDTFSMNSINNPFPFYSIATRNATNTMPAYTNQAPALPVQPVGHTFFTQRVAQPQALSDIPDNPFFYYSPPTTAVYENTAPAPVLEVAQFPFRGAYLPWSLPEQPQAPIIDVEVVPAPVSQDLIDTAKEEPYKWPAQIEQASTPSIEPVVVDTTIETRVAVQSEAAGDNRDEPEVSRLPASSGKHEETPPLQAPEEEANFPASPANVPLTPEALTAGIASIGPLPSPETDVVPHSPFPKQDVSKENKGSPGTTRASEALGQFPIRRTKAHDSSQAAHNSANTKGNAIAKEPNMKGKRKGDKEKKIQTIKKKTTDSRHRFHPPSTLQVKPEAEVEGMIEDDEDAIEVDDMLDNLMYGSDEDEDVQIDDVSCVTG